MSSCFVLEPLQLREAGSAAPCQVPLGPGFQVGLRALSRNTGTRVSGRIEGLVKNTGTRVLGRIEGLVKKKVRLRALS